MQKKMEIILELEHRQNMPKFPFRRLILNEEIPNFHTPVLFLSFDLLMLDVFFHVHNFLLINIKYFYV